ncbi:MAG: glycosyltransferase family 2 protein [Lachnospiraceae bacterium]|nr:glycosyltransferase family 2 protein [Lachnospiraceae bacterium]
MISFVIPCYNSGNTLEGVINGIDSAMHERPDEKYEIVLVNDCSPDSTGKVIASLCEKKKYIKGIELVRNFGQHSALMAGFHYVKGDIVVCMDDDGQTPADEAWKLIEQIYRGHDVAYARYKEKHHSFFRNFGSKLNDIMADVMLNKPKDLYISSYFAIKRFLVDEMVKYSNPYPYVIGLVLRSTKDIVNVDITHHERITGVSGYNLGKLIGLWMNGFTAFSIKPLRIATGCGAIMALGGFIYGLITIIRKLLGLNYILGYSGVITILTIIGGIMLLMLGIIGEYIGRIYISLNNSPQYIIRSVINDTDENS